MGGKSIASNAALAQPAPKRPVERRLLVAGPPWVRRRGQIPQAYGQFFFRDDLRQPAVRARSLILVKVPALQPGKGGPERLEGEDSMTAFSERDEWHAFSDGAALLGIAVCAVIGLIWAVAGKDPGIALHGAVLLIAAAMAGVYVLDRLSGKAPPPQETGYADGVVRAGVIATVVWGLAGFIAGDVSAWQLAYPSLNLDLP